MSHLFQVGVGSGGMVVLDLLARDERVSKFTIVDPDVYKSHNVVRHYHPAADVGKKKTDLAARWIKERPRSGNCGDRRRLDGPFASGRN